MSTVRSPQPQQPATAAQQDFDIVIVGAGFAGLYMLHRSQQRGLRARLFEAGSGIGGTWFWNRYPGARVDVESMEYSYSFDDALQQEWSWSERYAGQPELMRYINHCAERFKLWPNIQLNTRVTAATFDDSARDWNITTDAGRRRASQVLRTRHRLSFGRQHSRIRRARRLSRRYLPDITLAGGRSRFQWATRGRDRNRLVCGPGHPHHRDNKSTIYAFFNVPRRFPFRCVTSRSTASLRRA